LRILGLDPGLAVSGYGAIETIGPRLALCEAGTISTESSQPLEQRLLKIHEELDELFAELRPDVAAVEELYANYNHPRTAILMGHARGVLFLVAAARGVPVVSYSATRIKSFLTGNGHASKGQMQRMVEQTLSLDRPPKPDHVADALAAALCHANVVARGRAMRRVRR